MSSSWLFGTYFSYNINTDLKLTPNPSVAKWRSQYPVPEGSQFIVPPNSWVYFQKYNGVSYIIVQLVFIPDLAYQLKNTAPIGDQFWLKSAEGEKRVSSIYLAGRSSILQTFKTSTESFISGSSSSNPNAIAFVKPAPIPKPLPMVGYLSFSESKLELGYDYGAVGGMSFSNQIVKMADDSIEQRNASLHLPLGRWQLGDRLIAESATNDLAEVTYLKQFHLERVGSFQGFRFRDWSDFEGKLEHVATGDGVKNEFQLRKAYLVTGSWSYRPIQKPVFGSVSIFVNDVLDTPNWTIDHSTGVISKTAPVPDGALIRASFEFDVPVWFESDQIGFSLQGYEEQSGDAIYRLESVFVVEQRLPLALPWRVRPLTPITDTLDLGIIYDTTEQYNFLTDKQALFNGYTARVSKYQGSSQNSRTCFNLGSKTYDYQEVETILAFFWNARGSLASFDFINNGRVYRVRFNQDELNFKFEAGSGSDRFFSLAGLKLVSDY